jgi:omega-6 fatty acid desaturase (delta-12 desaturase)
METRGASSDKRLTREKTGRKWPAWHSSLSDYRKPTTVIAVWQLLNTFLPYCGLWILMVLSIQHNYPYAITLILALVAALFLVRLFILFHDCVHGSLFPQKTANTFFGHTLGLLVFTPFDDWRFSHLRHHTTYANLDARGFGDIWTMTKTEYEKTGPAKRLAYRLYRHPLVLIGLGALFSFLLRYRLPARKSKRKERISVIFTNLLIFLIVLAASSTMGWQTYLLIQLPVIWLAGSMGIWLFYVQHQFEGGYWARKSDWDPMLAAMEGSSFYKLPTVLRWFSANIGYHHVHHLNPRIPNYRIKDCHDAIPALQDKTPLSISRSLSGINLKLWDEEREKLVDFP